MASKRSSPTRPWHVIQPGAKVVPKMTWKWRLYNVVPLFIRRWFWA